MERSRQSNLSTIISIQIILLAIVVQCGNVDKFNSDFDQFKKGLFSIRNGDISKLIRKTVFSNWTDNQDCSIELDAIKSALANAEEWAFKSEFEFL